MTRHLCLISIVLLPSIVWAGATVSDERRVTRNRGSVSWSGQSAIDNDPATAWMVPGESQNTGEHITIQVPKGNVNGVSLWAGFGQDETTYADYARLRNIRIDALCCEGDENMTTLSSTTVELADENRLQFVDLEDFAIGNEFGFGGLVRITVESVYEGMDYTNFAVSEVRVVMAEFDLPAFSIPEATGDDIDHLSDQLNDGNARTYWASPVDGASIGVRAGGYGLSSIGIQSGPTSHARPKRVRITANNRMVEHDLENNADVQYVEAPSITGYNGSAWGTVSIEILEVYPGSSAAEVAIAEISLRATNFDGF
jgi:hypothetical protein